MTPQLLHVEQYNQVGYDAAGWLLKVCRVDDAATRKSAMTPQLLHAPSSAIQITAPPSAIQIQQRHQALYKFCSAVKRYTNSVAPPSAIQILQRHQALYKFCSAVKRYTNLVAPPSAL
jgi:hypothetical protein